MFMGVPTKKSAGLGVILGIAHPRRGSKPARTDDWEKRSARRAEFFALPHLPTQVLYQLSQSGRAADISREYDKG